MTPIQEMERLSAAQLERMAEDPQIPVPDGLSAKAADALAAIVLAERGPGALDSAPARRPGTRRRWLWAAVPAVALASLAAVLLVGRPRPLPPEAEAAYAQFEKAFSYFSEAITDGMDSFSTPYQETLYIPEK